MLSLTDHLTLIVATIRAVIGLLIPPVPARESHAQMVQLLFNRVGRAARLFARLHALWLENRLPAPRAPRARTAKVQTAPTRPLPPPIPRAKGWFLNAGQHHAGLAHFRLNAFLARADLPEFLAAVPQAGRYLRPLCRLLAVPQPDFLALPPRPHRKRASRPRAPRPPSLRNPQLPPGDPPFRPYVLAAARYFQKTYGNGT
ncbi:MAG: hypothetical protein NTY94_22185 [Alphaproteobacteria bacterium]|nr:hypothetical protein [Alphaproteobacteria bacterium]